MNHRAPRLKLHLLRNKPSHFLQAITDMVVTIFHTPKTHKTTVALTADLIKQIMGIKVQLNKIIISHLDRMAIIRRQMDIIRIMTIPRIQRHTVIQHHFISIRDKSGLLNSTTGIKLK